MNWHAINIEQETVKNEDFRRVLYTGKHMQLVLMSLKPNEDIGMETHNKNDQFFRFEQWAGRCIIDWTEHTVWDGSSIVVPAWAKHNIINTSDSEDLKMYTIYAPPHHKDWIVRNTKQQAENNEEDFDGTVTE